MLSFQLKENKSIAYDLTMSCLALLVVGILFIENRCDLNAQQVKLIYIIDLSIWVIFVIDYFTRFFAAKNKIQYVKNNVIELIAILPFNALFKGLRAIRIIRLVKTTKLIRLFRLFRVFSYLNRLKKKISMFVETNNFHQVLWLTFTTIMMGAIAISYLENMSLSDAIWWSFVTTTTVGYGDISPASTGGRLVAVILMLVGIGFLGMLTGTIATYFLQDRHCKALSYQEECISGIITKLEDFESLSPSEVSDICSVLHSLKYSNERSVYVEK